MNPRAERLLQHSNIYNQANTESVSQNDWRANPRHPRRATHPFPFIFWLI